MHVVLDFGLSQGRSVLHAPVNRLQSLVDESLLQKLKKQSRRSSIRTPAGHGGVGVVPPAKNSQTLKLRSLQVEILLGILAAGAADRDGRHLQLLAPELLVDLDLDGQAVAIPPRHVGRVKAGHRLRLHDEILQALVERVAQVDWPIGVRRPIVQHVGRRSFASRCESARRGISGPGSEPFRLVLGQIGLHGEVGVG